MLDKNGLMLIIGNKVKAGEHIFTAEKAFDCDDIILRRTDENGNDWFLHVWTGDEEIIG